MLCYLILPVHCFWFADLMENLHGNFWDGNVDFKLKTTYMSLMLMFESSFSTCIMVFWCDWFSCCTSFQIGLNL